MIEQDKLADQLSYDAVSITEHHLMMPVPLQFAAKLALILGVGQGVFEMDRMCVPLFDSRENSQLLDF